MNTLDQTVQATSGIAARGLQVHAGRQRHHLSGGDGHLLGVPTAARSAQTSSPTLQPSTPCADGADPTRALQPEHVGGALGRWVEALSLQGVGAVDRAGDDVDDDLAGTRLRVGQVGDGQGLGTTRVGCGDGAHAATLGVLTGEPGGARPGRSDLDLGSTSSSTSTSTSSSSCSSSSGDLSQRSASGTPGRPAARPAAGGRRSLPRRTRAGRSRSAPPGVPPGAPRPGRGRGSAPRPPRPRCRARRRARRSSRAGSRPQS